MADGEYPSFFVLLKRGIFHFLNCHPIEMNNDNENMENSSFYVLVNILHFLSFSNCKSFIFCLFHPIDKKKWQCNERRI